MTTVHLKVARHDDAHWVEWDEFDDDRRTSSGLVAGSRRSLKRDAIEVLNDIHDRLVANNFDVRVDSSCEPSVVVEASLRQVEHATGRVLRQ